MLPPLATKPREALYGLSGVYLDAYNAVVQPQRRLSISIYALRRWAVQLGANGFWLLTALQQQTYKNKYGKCVVSHRVLSAEAGVGERTALRYLHEDEYTTSGLCHWVRPHRSSNTREYSKQIGKWVQPVSRYDVLMDAPFAAIDQRGLAQYLVERGGTGASAKDVAPLLENLIASRSLTDVLALLDEHAERFEPPAGWKKDTFLPTVADVVNALGVKMGGNGSGTKFMDLCSQVQRHIVAWDWVGQKYFFEKWLPILGPSLALVVVQLRSQCFWSERELRDTVEIRKSDLATMVGLTPKWLRQVCSKQHASLFFEEIEVGTKHRPSIFKVKLIEPITPGDQASYSALLNGITGDGQLGFPPAPVTGSFGGLTNEPELPGEVSAGVKGSFGGLTPVSGEVLPGVKGSFGGLTPISGEVLAGVKGSSGGLTPVSEEVLAGVKGSFGGLTPVSGEVLAEVKGSFGVDINTLLNTTPRITLQQQQHSEADAAAVAGSLLETFGIVQPFKGRILKKSGDVIPMRAWMLYAVTQSGFTEQNGIQKYVSKRLLDGDAPPEQSVRWAKLTPDEWRALWRASRGDGAGMTPALDAVIAEWVEDFGEMFPNGPFGDDDPAEEAKALQRIADEQDKYARDHAPVPTPPMSVEEALTHGYAIVKGDGNTISITQAWQDALRELQLQLTGATYDTWLRRSRAVTFQNGVFIIGVHNGYAKDWLENRLLQMVKRALCSAAHLEGIEIRFVVLNVVLDQEPGDLGRPEGT